MPVYQWARAKPLGVNGPDDRIEEGDTFRAPEQVGEAFGDLLEELDDDGQDVDREITFDGPADEAADAAEEATPDEGETPADLGADEVEIDGEVQDVQDVDPDVIGEDVQDLLDGTVDEVVDELETGEWDDRLGELEAAEAQGDDRVTVRRTIQARRGSGRD